MTRAFLTDRFMTGKNGSDFSVPRHVRGGSPQGLILGIFLFCATTDCFSNLDQPVTDVSAAAVGREGISSSDEEPNNGDCTPMRRRGARKRYMFDSSDDELSAIPSQYRLDSFFGRPHRWREEPLTDLIYIDDYNAVEKVSLHLSLIHI